MPELAPPMPDAIEDDTSWTTGFYVRATDSHGLTGFDVVAEQTKRVPAFVRGNLYAGTPLNGMETQGSGRRREALASDILGGYKISCIEEE